MQSMIANPKTIMNSSSFGFQFWLTFKVLSTDPEMLVKNKKCNTSKIPFRMAVSSVLLDVWNLISLYTTHYTPLYSDTIILHSLVLRYSYMTLPCTQIQLYFTPLYLDTAILHSLVLRYNYITLPCTQIKLYFTLLYSDTTIWHSLVLRYS